MLIIRNKGTVRKIKIPPDKLEALEKLDNSPRNMTERIKQTILKEIFGGLCCICREKPSHEVIYDVSDIRDKATMIERYCSECLDLCLKREPTSAE